jgi:TPR repeat protein
MGTLYRDGLGVQQNYAHAMELFQKAINKDSNRNRKCCRKALNRIVLLHKNGSGVPQIYDKAVEYFERSAEMDCAEAYNSLGDMCKYRLGVEENYKKAFEWYLKAAESLYYDEEDQHNLGIM